MRWIKFFTIFNLFMLSEQIFAQKTAADSLLTEISTPTEADSLLAELSAEMDKPKLLPERMLVTQNILWGQKGLYRALGIIPKLNEESREKELKIRRNFLKIHQAVGLITLAGMIAQGIVGAKLYSNYSDDLKSFHTGLATGINFAYGTTAFMAFAAPPPLVSRKGSSSAKWHKYLGYIHLTGMIATNILSHQAAQNPDYKPYHRAAAYTTFAAFAASIVVFTFNF